MRCGGSTSIRPIRHLLLGQEGHRSKSQWGCSLGWRPEGPSTAARRNGDAAFGWQPGSEGHSLPVCSRDKYISRWKPVDSTGSSMWNHSNRDAPVDVGEMEWWENVHS